MGQDNRTDNQGIYIHSSKYTINIQHNPYIFPYSHIHVQCECIESQVRETHVTKGRAKDTPPLAMSHDLVIGLRHVGHVYATAVQAIRVVPVSVDLLI